jgi:hypothetical protein
VLGASTTPMRLNRALHDVGPESVAISCSVLGALPAARRFIEAGTAAGIPVVVGGSAFGPDDRRAQAVAPRLPADALAEQSALEMEHRRLVERLRERWSRVARAEPGSEAVTEVAGDSVPQVLHAVWAALLTGDPRPVSETAVWIAEVLRSRSADAAFVDELGRLTSAALYDYPLSQALVEQHFRR